ncbi:MAG: BatD family protein, partial [Flavobacteriales bacterium]
MWKRSIIPVVLFLISGSMLCAQQVTFQASVDRNEIAVGEADKLTIALSNSPSGGSMTTPDLGGLTVVQGPYESNSFSSINGSISRS